MATDHEMAQAARQSCTNRGLQKAGSRGDWILCKGHASAILDKLSLRRSVGIATPKQIVLMARLGYQIPL